MNRKLPSNDIIIKMYRSGLSTGEIAEKYNVAPTTVVGLLRRAGEPRRNPKQASELCVKHERLKPPSFWKDKKQPKAMVEKRSVQIRGKNHYLWKGGKSKRDYRKIIKKEKCCECGSKLNLGIHHKNFDHYDNRKDNLQVLCVSCHISLHKKQYWNSVKNNTEPKRSNGIVGWNRKKKD